MRTEHAVISLFLAVTVIPPVLAQSFILQDTFVGYDFFDAWAWYTADDLTHGRVNYVDQDTAKSSNISYASENKFVMRADDSNIVSPDARGRDSIRITSNSAYEDVVLVLDLEHMPEGCSTWPAFWTLSAIGPWPSGGEIDIIEGVNLNTNNVATLHTLPNCTMAETRLQTGATASTDCDTTVDFNLGCGTKFNEDYSYGKGFNAVSGGYYAMQKTSFDGIKVWFWPRHHANVPPEVKHGSDNILPHADWGVPNAAFSFDSCDYNSHFNAHQVIFDLTFCGDMAGNLWPTSGCGSDTCEDFVNNNPKAFSNAYWEINALRIYTPRD